MAVLQVMFGDEECKFGKYPRMGSTGAEHVGGTWRIA